MKATAVTPNHSVNRPETLVLPNTNESDATTRTLWFMLAVAISALEALIPRIPIFPWLKPGFSNMVTILWIIEYGTIDALLFSFLRVWISGFYLGFSLFSLGLGLCGAVWATLGMGILWRYLGSRRWLGTVGLGICGACLHNAGQLAAIAVLLGMRSNLLVQVPVMLGASLIFGGLTGWMVIPLGRFLASRNIKHAMPTSQRLSLEKISKLSWIISACVLTASLGLLAVRQVGALCGCAVVATALAFAITRNPWMVVRRNILRFWPMFVFIAFSNCLQPAGTFLAGLPFVTREAAMDTTCQWLRLWSWLACSAVLSKAQFDKILFSLLWFVFKRHGATLNAAAVALAHFGEVFSAAVNASKIAISKGMMNPRTVAHSWLVTIFGEIEHRIELIDAQGAAESHTD
jgi:uncharacterized membrane protein